MHIPDGFFDAKVALATGALAVVGLGAALRHARLRLPARRVPLLGLSAAFVFAAQMLNFPVAGGTSGHLIGGVLAAVLLGPSAAVIAISAVLIVQCFLFADGGITALGGNIFNMALIGGAGGWAIFHLFRRAAGGTLGLVLAAGLAAWGSTVLAAIACAGELAASGTIAWSRAFPAMVGVHVLIGVGESIITVLVLLAIAKVRPDLLGLAGPQRRGMEVMAPSSLDYASSRLGGEKAGTLLIFGLLISLGLALFVAPFACPWPDGLDKTAAVLGFKHRESPTRALPAPICDYKMPGISSEGVATGIAGAAGTVIVFGLAWMLTRALFCKSDVEPLVDAAASSP